MLKTLKLLVAAVILIGVSEQAYSQTVLIKAGVDQRGETIFINAYEYNCVDEKPCFPGGDSKLLEFINNNRKYPADAYNRGIQGRVKCQFIVNPDGSISNVSLLRSVHTLLDNEAIRILNMMPNWIPGRINGVAVPTRVVEVIKFRK